MHPLAPAALLLTLAAPPADTAAVVAVTDAVAPAPVAPAPVAAAPVAAAEPVWQTNLNSAFKLSGETGKPMLVLFGAEWCGYCHKQDAETLSDPAVRRALAAGSCRSGWTSTPTAAPPRSWRSRPCRRP